jgi:hypothetical protein
MHALISISISKYLNKFQASPDHRIDHCSSYSSLSLWSTYVSYSTAFGSFLLEREADAYLAMDSVLLFLSLSLSPRLPISTNPFSSTTPQPH